LWLGKHNDYFDKLRVVNPNHEDVRNVDFIESALKSAEKIQAIAASRVHNRKIDTWWTQQ